MRLFRSATCPSTWRAHGSSPFFALPALAAGVAGELADRYVPRRETPPGWPSIESIILEHSVYSTTSHAVVGAKLMPAPTSAIAFIGRSRTCRLTRGLAGSGGQIREFRHEDVTDHRTHYGVCSRCRWRPGGFERGVQVRSAPLVRTRATSSEGRHVTRSGQRPPSWSCSRQIVQIGAASRSAGRHRGRTIPPLRSSNRPRSASSKTPFPPQ
jgi:hypothetical protein